MHIPSFTRRTFFKAGAASAATVAAIGVLSGCTHKSNDDEDSEPVVVAPDSATSVLDSFQSVDATLQEAHNWTLPLGTVLRPAEGMWIPVTLAETSTTMVKAGALSLSSGTVSEVVASPVVSSPMNVIYDVRCSDALYAWLELDLSTREWTLYASAFSAGKLTGNKSTLWQASSDYEPAGFAVSDTSVVWQIQPTAGGSKAKEHSFCYLWHLGDESAKNVVESAGRFATSPQVSADAVILSPRVRAKEGVYYGVTAYSLSDDLTTKLDQLVMPVNVKPFRATRVGDRFCVSVEANYSTGGLLGQMGTYLGTSSAGFARIALEPSEICCGKGDIFVIKNNAAYFVIDLSKQTYASLPAVDRALDYGEFPARTGECSTFVSFSTVKDADGGYPASVCVRTFSL